MTFDPPQKKFWMTSPKVLWQKSENHPMEKKQLLKILSKLQKTPKTNKKKWKEKIFRNLHWWWNTCHACKNLLNDNIKMSQKQKSYLRKKLAPIKEVIRKLSKTKTFVKKKRELLKEDQIGKELFWHVEINFVHWPLLVGQINPIWHGEGS